MLDGTLFDFNQSITCPYSQTPWVDNLLTGFGYNYGPWLGTNNVYVGDANNILFGVCTVQDGDPGQLRLMALPLYYLPPTGTASVNEWRAWSATASDVRSRELLGDPLSRGWRRTTIHKKTLSLCE